MSRLLRFYKIYFKIFEYFAHYAFNNILNSFACSSGTWFSRKKTCLFSSPLNRSWLQPARVPRRLLRKFCFFFLRVLNNECMHTYLRLVMRTSRFFMFVKVSFICGKWKRVLLAVKKEKRQTTCNTNKKKISVSNILFLSLEPTWSGLNNMTIVFVRRFSFLNHSRQRKEASQGAKFGIK